MAKSSAAHIKANNKYNKANYHRIAVNAKKHDYDLISTYCGKCNVSIPTMFLLAAAEYMANHPAPKDAVADDLTELSDLLTDNSDID